MVGGLIPEKFMNPNGSFYWALYNSLVNKFKESDHYCLIATLSKEEELSLTLPKFLSDEKVTSLISLGQLSVDYVNRLKETNVPMILLDYYRIYRLCQGYVQHFRPLHGIYEGDAREWSYCPSRVDP